MDHKSDEGNWNVPSKRMRTMRLVEVAVVTVVIALLLGIADASSSAIDGLLSAGIALVCGGLASWWISRRFSSWGYRERDDDLMIRRGLMFRRLSVVPYGRMQFVDVTAGPIERIFRLSTVKLHTAAASSDARIPGLQQDEAQRLRDQLARLGEANLAGL